ncbi:hypothetical protein Lal_00028505 [Lupinus albus]|nr:hypothetical protein Lal_00028505 [Lupinus albus]
MWDTLEITHEGTEEVKRSRLNTLSQEYEMFRMRPGEKILDLQKRFTHLTNHLIALGKEHELELSQLGQHEELEKKKKNIYLKAKAEKYDSSEDEDDKEETDDMSLFVKKFNKHFECGKPGHMKMECPNIKKSSFKGKNELKNGRRAYIAWEDNDTSSASEPESEEHVHLSLMASHHSDDEEGTTRLDDVSRFDVSVKKVNTVTKRLCNMDSQDLPKD